MALAYLDQLQRTNAVPQGTIAELTTALDNAKTQLRNGAHDKKLADALESLAAKVKKGKGNGETAKQRSGLAGTLSGIAARLR